MSQIEKQNELAHQIKQATGVNITTCGNCGVVLLHKVTDEEIQIQCHGCDETMELHDCPDVFDAPKTAELKPKEVTAKVSLKTEGLVLDAVTFTVPKEILEKITSAKAVLKGNDSIDHVSLNVTLDITQYSDGSEINDWFYFRSDIMYINVRRNSESLICHGKDDLTSFFEVDFFKNSLI